jgi:hypothetical protein
MNVGMQMRSTGTVQGGSRTGLEDIVRELGVDMNDSSLQQILYVYIFHN